MVNAIQEDDVREIQGKRFAEGPDDVRWTDESRERGFVEMRKPCRRCGGAGGADAWKHTGWTCYECNGSGVDSKTVRIYTVERRAKLDAANAKRQATLAAKKEAAEAIVRAERDAAKFEIRKRFPETFSILDELIERIEREAETRCYPDIRNDISNEGVSDYAIETAIRWVQGKEVDDERLEKVVEVHDKFETAKREREAREQIEIDRKANATHVATIAGNGVELRGEILSIQSRENGYGENVVKMLFQDERGFRLWGTVARALLNEIFDRKLVRWSREQQDYFLTAGPIEVAFVANVDASDDDPVFGFFKRPRKGEVFSPAIEVEDDES